MAWLIKRASKSAGHEYSEPKDILKEESEEYRAQDKNYDKKYYCKNTDNEPKK